MKRTQCINLGCKHTSPFTQTDNNNNGNNGGSAPVNNQITDGMQSKHMCRPCGAKNVPMTKWCMSCRRCRVCCGKPVFNSDHIHPDLVIPRSI
ncbi:hypothetical protein BGZ91_005272 [Linnemannia elongata]|nr:hypothetical protein BGZ91_005272 [Linnemannia elongata]